MKPSQNLDNQIIIYETPDGRQMVEVKFEHETAWLTQKRIAELFGVETHTINYHVKEVFKSKELQEDAVIRNFRITARDGKNYDTLFYNQC